MGWGGSFKFMSWTSNWMAELVVALHSHSTFSVLVISEFEHVLTASFSTETACLFQHGQSAEPDAWLGDR